MLPTTASGAIAGVLLTLTAGHCVARAGVVAVTNVGTSPMDTLAVLVIFEIPELTKPTCTRNVTVLVCPTASEPRLRPLPSSGMVEPAMSSAMETPLTLVVPFMYAVLTGAVSVTDAFTAITP